jgi:exosortase/archaeosortase family protein
LFGAVLAWIAIIVSARADVEGPGHPFDGLAVLVASVVKRVLGWSGLAVSQYAGVLFVPGGFLYVVSIGCTGIVPAAVIAIAILASPASAAARVVGLAAAVPLVLLVNVGRLVHLFYLGVYRPRSFAMAHEVFWECALVLCTVAIWYAWWSWASRVLSGPTAPARSTHRSAAEAPVG